MDLNVAKSKLYNTRLFANFLIILASLPDSCYHNHPTQYRIMNFCYLRPSAPLRVSVFCHFLSDSNSDEMPHHSTLVLTSEKLLKVLGNTNK